MALAEWVQERVPYRGVMNFLRRKEVPRHRYAVGYYTGGITLFLFILQVLTGLLLLMYYRPTADAAFESVRFIISKVRFGWLVRQIHVWSANLMVLAAALHLATTFFTRAYRRPREVTWLSGVGLLFLVLAFGFTGYLLPWNTLAYFATKVGTEIVGDVPLVGRPLRILLRGGEDVTEATLSRFFGIHVAILPAVTTLLLAAHLLLVQVHGMSRPIGVPVFPGEPFYPHFVLRDFLVWVLLLGAVASLATLVPWPLGEKADPLAPAPAGLRPEWYFLFMYQSL
ncbi:MAG TPA: cytochrome b N-terminal domain-containing protein, partial [bacterium]|nr:cytochrome b N-terminal domain-containing protein [bacterium]